MAVWRVWVAAVNKNTAQMIGGTLFWISGFIWKLVVLWKPDMDSRFYSSVGLLFVIGTLIFVHGTFVAWREEYLKRLTMEDRLKPKVGLRHDFEGAPDYLRTANISADVLERRHIVGVVNLSAVAIPQLNMVAERFEPYVQGATWIDAPMHPLRVNPDNNGRFDLSVGDGGPSRFIEVFQELVFIDGRPPALTFVYDSTGLQKLKRFIVSDWFAVTLRVQGDIPPRRIRLVARLNTLKNTYDVAESDEPRPSETTCQLAQLTDGQVPRAEPRGDTSPI